MTKAEAIKRVLEDNGGVANWPIIYNQIEKYYPEIKKSKDWKNGIRGVLYRDIGKGFKKIDNGIYSLLDYNEENLNLIEKEDIGGTSKKIVSNIRIGQSKFRDKLLKLFKKCPITGISEKQILNASHIKPWAVSDNNERMDIYNGFIFSPTVDKLFDKGLITFEDNKTIIISSIISKYNIAKLGLRSGTKYPELDINGREKYLDYHRKNIFLIE